MILTIIEPGLLGVTHQRQPHPAAQHALGSRLKHGAKGGLRVVCRRPPSSLERNVPDSAHESRRAA
jgi:hypothetical protein